MAQFNENITLAAPNPLDKRYLSNRTLCGSQLPYSADTEVYSTISSAVRYTGLTVLISTGGTNVEYWFKEGVANSDLIEKKYDTVIPSGDFITGATNLGYFSGFTGIQTLPITDFPDTAYNGAYHSLYNYYYRDSFEGKIHIGIPNDGISKRGYVKTDAQIKSWVWNEYTGDTVSQVGWILVDGNIANQLGTYPVVMPYYPPSTPYTASTWTTWCSNGSEVSVGVPLGSLTTGTTLTIGGRPFSYKDHNVLHLRTVVSETPSLIAVRDDESFIYLSAVTTTVQGTNVGIGADVYKGITGTTLYFRRIEGAGNTTVTQSGDTIVVYSSGGTGGGLYDLSTPAAITVGGIVSGTTLTGKTAFELFEELLVPTLYPTLTNPSVSIGLNPSGTFEVGYCIPVLCVTSTFNAGCICPQYPPTACNKRSNGACAYCFTGSPITGCYACTNSSLTECATNYSVLAGTAPNTWDTCVHYCCGVQPYDSKGSCYCTPLSAGVTACVSASITGIYPYYYGKLTSGSRPPVTNSLVTGGTKVVASSTGTVTVTFGSSSSEYTWLAIPSISTSKICWYVNALDNGFMNRGCSADKYPDECIFSICSGQGCWTGINYKVYMSKTIGAIIAPLEFRNS
jgi:hypothetical protein